MKYTSEYINSISFDDFLDLMANELNENNYEISGIGKFSVSHDDPVMKRHFMMLVVDNPMALAHLRSVGLLDNGRCPTCGAPMNTGTRYYWYDRRYPEHRFSLCYGCHETRFHGDGHTLNGTTRSVPPRPTNSNNTSSSGCVLGLLLMPYNLLLALFH